jgi:carboxypeptidase C (cathepsin A)
MARPVFRLLLPLFLGTFLAAQPAPEKKADPLAPKADPLHFDMKDADPVVTHHEVRTAEGKVLKYTATAGRLPIKELDGTTAAQMFYVAYTLDGAEPGKRPVTFAFNGGPGSASLWLHMGALGPRKVVLGPDGFLPPPPYKLQDNPHTPLDRTDLVIVDAIGTGFSRPADLVKARKFWGMNGDIEAFGEFVRMYLGRFERWSSPLYLFGESYGTMRAAGVAGHLAAKGISFNGIVLLSTILNFGTAGFGQASDTAYPLILPSFTMIAAYHKRLAPDLMADLEKTRAEVEHWAATEYTTALGMGDALPAAQRQAVIEKLARYTGLKPELIDQADLRIDVAKFTHNLLAEQKLRVGRLDGRYAAPDSRGYLEASPFYDPTSSNTMAPFMTALCDYLRRELGCKGDTEYLASARELPGWDWELPKDQRGGAETASLLREAMVGNKWLKVLVMEGYYDLATPYFAANYTMDHLKLPASFRKNIAYATYDAGHMVYLRESGLVKMKKDFADFIAATLPAAP